MEVTAAQVMENLTVVVILRWLLDD